MKKIVILQSNYIPWKGYFDLINDADLFIFHDDLQYTKNDWRNRNKIKGRDGTEWLTIPVGTSEDRLICEVEIKDDSWQRKHWLRIKEVYGRCQYFPFFEPFFKEVYVDRKWKNLSDLNQYLIKEISRQFLGINTEFADSRTFSLKEKKHARVLELLNKVGGTHYISGPAAKDYIVEADFKASDIGLTWKDYIGYPDYNQPLPPFAHGVSILDLLFCCGPHSSWYGWGWRDGPLTS